jgi:molybdate transport system regulatory protein
MSGRSKPRKHSTSAGLASGTSRQGCRLSGRLWIERSGRTVLSWGRITLLERIREHGSISAAARSMGMGYRHAWELVDEMNALSPRLLVERMTGGTKGGGAALTPHGEAAIASFWALVARFETWLSRQEPGLWNGAAT